MDRRRSALSAGALAALPVAFLGLFFALPVGAILKRSLGDGVPFDVLTDGRTLRILWFTTWQAALSSLLTLLAAFPITWALSRHSFRGRRLVEALVLVPFVLPTVVVATAFLLILPDGLERSVPAILLAHVFFNIAVVARIVGSVWRGLDRRLDDAAASLGLGSLMRFRRVTLPLLIPAIAAATAMVFLFCFTSFGVIVILGGPARATLETEIYNQAVRAFDLPTGAALALLQLLVVGAAVTVGAALERRATPRTAIGSRPAPRDSRRGRRLRLAAVTITTLALGAPLALLVQQSVAVTGTLGVGAYQRLFEETPALLVTPWHAVVNSLLFASVATAIALAVAVPAAYLVSGGRRLLDLVMMLPLGASAAMLGFGFLLAFADPPLDLRGSPWIVPVAQSLVATPFALRALVPAVRAIDPRLREVAAALGQAPRASFFKVDLPVLAPALAVAAGLAFAISLGEFGATVFVARADWPTLPVAIFRLLGRPGAENLATATALSVVLAALAAAAALVSQLVLGRRG